MKGQVACYILELEISGMVLRYETLYSYWSFHLKIGVIGSCRDAATYGGHDANKR